MTPTRLLLFALLAAFCLSCDAGEVVLAEPTLTAGLGVILSAVVIYLVLLTWSRIVGPRSFSQMTAFDFGVTVAIGAIVGGTATGSTPLWGGVLGLSMLFVLRSLIGYLRRYGFSRLVDNRPILVMAHDQILDDNLRAAQITRVDILEALRISGVTRFEQVLAVIVERNGELSVLEKGGGWDDALLEPVAGSERLRRRQ